MAVPKFYFFIEPVLRTLADADAPMRRRDILERAPRHLDLSDADMATMAGKGRLTQVEDRTGWALSYASMSGLVESPKRGMWAITSTGKAELELHPGGIPLERLHDIRRGARTGDPTENEAVPADEALAPADLESIADGSGETPDERLRAAYAEIRNSIANELLSLVRNAEPAFFETLVLDLLHAMGYVRLSTTYQGETPDVWLRV
jgi:restriction system protein